MTLDSNVSTFSSLLRAFFLFMRTLSVLYQRCRDMVALLATTAAQHRSPPPIGVEKYSLFYTVGTGFKKCPISRTSSFTFAQVFGQSNFSKEEHNFPVALCPHRYRYSEPRPHLRDADLVADEVRLAATTLMLLNT